MYGFKDGFPNQTSTTYILKDHKETSTFDSQAILSQSFLIWPQPLVVQIVSSLSNLIENVKAPVDPCSAELVELVSDQAYFYRCFPLSILLVLARVVSLESRARPFASFEMQNWKIKFEIPRFKRELEVIWERQVSLQ